MGGRREAARVAVTGGAGFIGARLVRRLLDRSDRPAIIVLDDFRASPHTEESLRALWGGGGRVRLIREPLEVSAPELGGPIDSVFHLASIVGTVRVLEHGGTIASAIQAETSAAVALARRTGARLLSVSTSEVYGAGDGGACTEELPAQFGPHPSARAEYAAAKYTQEVALRNLVARGLLHATIVRPFNVAGPGQSAEGGHVLPRFLQQAARGEPLTVYGDGSQRRAFSHVDDVAAALELVDANAPAGAVYDLGVPRNRTTIGELAQLVVEVTGSTAGIERVDPRQLHGDLFAEAPERWPESQRIHELGWKPQRDLRAIVADAWEFLRK